MDYLLSGALGALIAFVFSIPAIVLEYTTDGTAEETPLVIDVKSIFGIKLRRTEVFLVGLLIHILIGFLFGLVYVVFVQQGWLFVTSDPYSFPSLFVYAILSWVMVNVVIYPLLGMGLFAQKEGPTVWLETLVAHLLLGSALWLLVQYYQPSFFMPTL